VQEVQGACAPRTVCAKSPGDTSGVYNSHVVHSCVLVVVTVLGACGRIGFAPGDAPGDAPTPLGAPRSIAAGRVVSCAVVDDGSLWCWGSIANQSLGSPVTGAIVSPTRVGSDTDWVEVVVGAAYACARKQDGSLWCWGSNAAFAFGSDPSTVEIVPVRVEGPADWAAITIGAGTCGLHDDGSASCFGAWTGGATQAIIEPGRTFRSIAGNSTDAGISCALDAGGALWCWWIDSFGMTAPMQQDAGPDTAVAVGDTAVLLVRADGTLWTLPLTSPPSPATQLSPASGWTSPTAGFGYGCAARDGALWCWGDNDVGQQGDARAAGRAVPSMIDGDHTFDHLSSGGKHTCAARDGVLVCTGLGTSGELGDGVVRWGSSATLPSTWTGRLDTADYTISFNSVSVAVGSDARAYWWGILGRLNDPRTESAPAPIGSMAVLDAAALGYGVAAIRTDGTLWLWGRLYEDDAHADLPVQIDTASTWRAVDGSLEHVCGLQADDSLWCWGRNLYGQLGDGTTTDHASPARVGSATYREVSTAVAATCGIQTDDTLWCWGRLAGTAGTTTSPRRIDNASWTHVAAGAFRVCGIHADGSLWCWGEPSGDLTESPRRVGADTDWSRVSCGDSHTCAIQQDGTLWCWGATCTGRSRIATSRCSTPRGASVRSISGWTWSRASTRPAGGRPRIRSSAWAGPQRSAVAWRGRHRSSRSPGDPARRMCPEQGRTRAVFGRCPRTFTRSSCARSRPLAPARLTRHSRPRPPPSSFPSACRAWERSWSNAPTSRTCAPRGTRRSARG
jgi:alpha-tubulin suppressor-like RCC1 family protein